MVSTTTWPLLHFQNGADIAWPNFVTYLSRLLAYQAEAVSHPLLYFEAAQRDWPRPFALWYTRRLVDQAKGSVLVVRQPRWPLQHILLLVRGDEGDEMAVFWAKTLAQASQCTVAIMPIIPAWPALYQKVNEVQANLDILLLPNTASGQRLRSYQKQLAQANVAHHFSQQAGTPDEQIQSEVVKTEPDLLVVGAERNGRLHRWYLGQIVNPLLGWLNRPVLIAKG